MEGLYFFELIRLFGLGQNNEKRYVSDCLESMRDGDCLYRPGPPMHGSMLKDQDRIESIPTRGRTDENIREFKEMLEAYYQREFTEWNVQERNFQDENGEEENGEQGKIQAANMHQGSEFRVAVDDSTADAGDIRERQAHASDVNGAAGDYAETAHLFTSDCWYDIYFNTARQIIYGIVRKDSEMTLATLESEQTENVIPGIWGMVKYSKGAYVRDWQPKRAADAEKMQLTYNEEILSIIRVRFATDWFRGYYGGLFSPGRDKFFAITYTRFDDTDLRFATYPIRNGHSIIGTDGVKEMKIIDGTHYQVKDTHQCIEEGVYRAFSVRFSGVFFEGEWYIEDDLTFVGEKLDEAEARRRLEPDFGLEGFWDRGGFQTGPYKFPSTFAHLNGRDVSMEPFDHMPDIVARIKEDRKSEIKRAFTNYMNVAVVLPFLQQLRIHFPDQFVAFYPLLGDFTLLFPESRDYFIVVASTEDVQENCQLVYFFYEPGGDSFYRWKYPQPRSIHRFHYSEEIITDISAICEWDHPDFFHPSRTLDNPGFWEGFVLKKEKGKYLYLEKVAIPANL